MPSESFNRVRNFVRSWQDKNIEYLNNELRKHKIGIEDELRESLENELFERGQHVLSAELTMLKRGRFVDMGVGKGVPLERVKTERYRSRGAKRKRRPKKWYSKLFYGRLNDLQGVVGHIMMEESSNIIAEAFE